MAHVQVPENDPRAGDDSSVSTVAGEPPRQHTAKPVTNPTDDLNLPYRTLSPNANLDEYRTETAAGTIEGPLEPDGQHRWKLVTFLKDDPENPKNWSKAYVGSAWQIWWKVSDMKCRYKWYCTMVVAATCFVVALASSVVTADIAGVAEEFDVSEEVALLTITLFVVGFGVGE